MRFFLLFVFYTSVGHALLLHRLIRLWDHIEAFQLFKVAQVIICLYMAAFTLMFTGTYTYMISRGLTIIEFAAVNKSGFDIKMVVSLVLTRSLA